MDKNWKKALAALLETRERVIVAIDGPCTAGKTTLAAALAEEYGCNVFHMDDFFLRPHQRTPERLAEAGGNVDYERFRAEVLEPLKAGKPFAYRPFDCSTQSLSAPVTVMPGRVSIVEGTYSHHPFFTDAWDLRLFLPVTIQTQRLRIMARPAFLHDRFFGEWIPMENAYFSAFSIREKSDFVLEEQG